MSFWELKKTVLVDLVFYLILLSYVIFSLSSLILLLYRFFPCVLTYLILPYICFRTLYYLNIRREEVPIKKPVCSLIRYFVLHNRNGNEAHTFLNMSMVRVGAPASSHKNGSLPVENNRTNHRNNALGSPKNNSNCCIEDQWK